MKKLLIKLIGLRLNILSLVVPDRVGSIALKAFGNPGKPNVNRKHLAFFETAERASIDFQGCKVQTYRWGNGPAKVLFLHGWQSHSYRWKRYIESFDKDKYTLYAIDGLAHGLSEGSFFNIVLYGKLIQTFIDKYGSMDFVVGHSMGCFASLYAFHTDASITPYGAVMLAAPGEVFEFFDGFRLMAGLSNRTMSLVERHFENTFHSSIRNFSAPGFARSLTIPGLLVHDLDDDDTSIEHSRRIHSQWKNSELIETKGYGHNLRSEEVVKLVYSFVTEQSVGALRQN